MGAATRQRFRANVLSWYLETQTVHRFAALPAWLAEDMTVYRGDNQDPAFIEKIRKLTSQQQDWPRHILIRKIEMSACPNQHPV